MKVSNGILAQEVTRDDIYKEPCYVDDHQHRSFLQAIYI